MGKKKKQFIDPKHCVRFHLIHRSQRDPEQANEEAPKRILLPIPSKRKRLEEQEKHGIYMDDDYDYMQHLRSTSQELAWPEASSKFFIPAPNSAKVRFNLPDEVFASKEQNQVGLLSLAAPASLNPNLDPEVRDAFVALEDIDEEGIDDVFSVLLNPEELKKDHTPLRQPGNEEEEEGMEVDELMEGEEDFSDADSMGLGSDFEDRVSSTQQTMSCRSVRTKPHEKMLDEWSDNFVAKYYPNNGEDDDEDDDEEGISWDNPALQQAMAADLKEFDDVEDCLEEMNKKEEIIVRIPEDEEEKVPVVIKEFLNYDIANKPRPKVIHKPQDLGKIIFGKDGLPKEPGRKLHSLKQLEDFQERRDSDEDPDFDSLKADRPSTYRPKGETAEERQMRKKAIKQDQAMRRQMKKMAQREGRGLQQKLVEGVSQNVASIRLV